MRNTLISLYDLLFGGPGFLFTRADNKNSFLKTPHTLLTMYYEIKSLQCWKVQSWLVEKKRQQQFHAAVNPMNYNINMLTKMATLMQLWFSCYGGDLLLSDCICGPSYRTEFMPCTLSLFRITWLEKSQALRIYLVII